MAIRPFIDVATRISPELSVIIEELVNDPDREHWTELPREFLR